MPFGIGKALKKVSKGVSRAFKGAAKAVTDDPLSAALGGVAFASIAGAVEGNRSGTPGDLDTTSPEQGLEGALVDEQQKADAERQEAARRARARAAQSGGTSLLNNLAGGLPNLTNVARRSLVGRQ